MDMLNIPANTDARERVLQAAERLFAERGYTAVTLRDIAGAVGIRHASLYHHVPGGKEELFIEVTERSLERHRHGLANALAHAQPNIQAQLRAAADWLLSQPPMDLVRMNNSDMPAIDAAHAERLMEMAGNALLEPLATVLAQAQARGEIHYHNLWLIAGGLLGMIESLYSAPESAIVESGRTRHMMAHDLIDVMLNGLRPRDRAHEPL
jgi:AcrR family transcriptional regulator